MIYVVAILAYAIGRGHQWWTDGYAWGEGYRAYENRVLAMHKAERQAWMAAPWQSFEKFGHHRVMLALEQLAGFTPHGFVYTSLIGKKKDATYEKLGDAEGK